MAGKFFKFPVIFLPFLHINYLEIKSGTLGYRNPALFRGMEMVKCGKNAKRPLTFLLALLLAFTDRASVQAEESTKAGSSDKAQTVVIQEDSTQKEDDVGAAASTEENVQQEIPEINSEVLQQRNRR